MILLFIATIIPYESMGSESGVPVTPIKVLINMVEMLAEENARLKETVQELKDEISILSISLGILAHREH